MKIVLGALEFGLHQWSWLSPNDRRQNIHDIWLELGWFAVRSDSWGYGSKWVFGFGEKAEITFFIYSPSYWKNLHYRPDDLRGWAKFSQGWIRGAITFQLLFVRFFLKISTNGDAREICNFYSD
jgi:hypothetical protein